MPLTTTEARAILGRSGALKWGERERIGSTMEPYYDVTTYRVPVTTPVTTDADVERIRKALYNRWANGLTGTAVGGYCTPRVRATDDPMVVEVDSVYHIGD